ncbi:YesK-like family protein [Bacillus sp. MYb209]|uniref:YesK-like family protein n=1 Tax=Bacillus sp. MYb209 TaxID=1848605 RepID=UPI001158DAAB|nr:YesK-like family protein [Bacillus sp. MYb209]
MDWLDGFSIFYIIGGITILLVFFISYLLKKRFPDKQFDIIFALSLVLLCLAFFPVTMMAIGGWEGMGYGFICFFVLLGTLIGMVAHQLVKIFRKSYV